ncbi:uncharacterized protein LOC129265735 [Lytechinus pictus]|uniref:uncharacterized protein LOC129265735 n=1 Tax=Lytechinus pictus TaxID=7653 RepID=UPI0030BA1B41
MRNFCFIRRKRNRFVISMPNYLWMPLIFTFLFLMIVAVYDDDDDDRRDITVIQNREILEEKQGLRSREEELLEMAAKLEMELLHHQERIKVRLETMNARKKGMDGGRELDSRHHHHHHQHLLDEGRVEGNEHRLKRRLMDARTSHGPGRHHGHSKSGSSGAITRDDQTIPDVKASKSNKTRAISRNTPKSRSMKRADMPDAMALLRTPHNENKKRSYHDDDNKEIIFHQSASTLSMRKHLAPGHHHKSKKAKNETKGSLDKHFEKSSDLKNVLGYQHDQSWDNSQKRLSVSDLISTNPVAAATTLNQPSIEAETNAALNLDEPYLGCEDLAHINSRELVGSGYTKRVERVELRDGRWVAVKSVWTEGNDVTACLDRGMAKRDCIQLANYKLLKETALLHQLRHPNIVKVRSNVTHIPFDV